MSNLLTKIDNSVVHLEIIADLIDALDDANSEGAGEFPSAALYIPAQHLRQTTKELRELVDRAFKECKKEAEAV